jgi:CubicO group peptidase (beta-lactamase class C family)
MTKPCSLPALTPSRRRIAVAMCTAVSVWLVLAWSPAPVAAADTGDGIRATSPASQAGGPATIAPARHARPLPASSEQLPETVPWRNDEEVPLDQFLTESHTLAFVVLHDRKLVTERYFLGTTKETPLPSWSVAKSMAGLLVGQAIRKRRLTLDTRLVDVLPWLRVTGRRSKGYNKITVRNLLDMTSGIDAPEDYDLASGSEGTIGMLLTPDLRQYVKLRRDMVVKPGEKFEYLSFNTQLLAMVLQQAFGKSYVRAFTQRLWRPAGAEFPATWDRDLRGVARGFCCLNATARDLARLGLLVLDANGARSAPVSRAWRRRLLTPRPHMDGDWGYSTGFWHPDGAKAGTRSADATAIGILGQYIYINTRTDTVIVKMSRHGIEQDERETFRAMRSIANSWAE